MFLLRKQQLKKPVLTHDYETRTQDSGRICSHALSIVTMIKVRRVRKVVSGECGVVYSRAAGDDRQDIAR